MAGRLDIWDRAHRHRQELTTTTKVVCIAKGAGPRPGATAAEVQSAMHDLILEQGGVDGYLREDEGEERMADRGQIIKARLSRPDYSVSCMAHCGSSVKPFMWGPCLTGREAGTRIQTSAPARRLKNKGTLWARWLLSPPAFPAIPQRVISSRWRQPFSRWPLVGC